MSGMEGALLFQLQILTNIQYQQINQNKCVNLILFMLRIIQNYQQQDNNSQMIVRSITNNLLINTTICMSKKGGNFRLQSQNQSLIDFQLPVNSYVKTIRYGLKSHKGVSLLDILQFSKDQKNHIKQGQNFIKQELKSFNRKKIANLSKNQKLSLSVNDMNKKQMLRSQELERKKQEKTSKKYYFKLQSLSLTQIINNSKKFMQVISCLITQKDFRQFTLKINKYLDKIDQLQQLFAKKDEIPKDRKMRIKKIQKQFFDNIQVFFSYIIPNKECRDQLMLLLQQCDVNVLKKEEISFYYGMEDQERSNSEALKKMNIIYRDQLFDTYNEANLSSYVLSTRSPNNIFNLEQQHSTVQFETDKSFSAINQLQNSEFQSSQENQHGRTFQKQMKEVKRFSSSDFDIKSANTNTDQFINQQKSLNLWNKPVSAGKLFTKKTSAQFQIKQQSLNQIGRRLFQSKKIVDEKVILNKNDKNSSLVQKQRIQFGQKWVYVYQLPYNLEKKNVQTFISHVQNKFGKIEQYVVFPYKNMLEHDRKQITYVIPDLNVMQTRRVSRYEKIQRLLNIKPVPSLEDSQKDKKKKPGKSSSQRILEKIRNQKEYRLNKSSMLIKFQDLKSKKDVLSPDTRLFGINFGFYHSIRFEQAQSKKFVAVSMIPWGCQSQEIIQCMNNELKYLDIQLTYPKCILAKSYLFIEFENFYESFYASQLLNNILFQNQNLKAQISYGSSKSHEGQFKSTLQLDHYDSLVKKLKEIRCFYSQLM